LLIDDGMPLHPYREQIVEFSELYQMCQEFHVTPNVIRKWKEEDPYEFTCFRMFMVGLAKKGKVKGESANG
jgi:hypothetical protein